MHTSQRALIQGFPRIGEGRELKRALESYWDGKTGRVELETTARELRSRHWATQAKAGLSYVCVNDFSLYDHMIDATMMLGAIAPRFMGIGDVLDTSFAMARGRGAIKTLAMKKWFNTNYHYFVPELEKGQWWELDASKPLAELAEAKALGHRPKLSLVGPLSYLRLSRYEGEPLDLLPSLLPVYAELIDTIQSAHPDALIQMEEPILVRDPDIELLEALEDAYLFLCEAASEGTLLVSTYFEHASEALPILARMPLWGIGLDFVYGYENLLAVERLAAERGWPGMRLVAGIVDGRNVWACDKPLALDLLARLASIAGKDQVIASSSCSLLHVPYSAGSETGLSPKLRTRLAFAHEKLAEVADLGRALEAGIGPRGEPRRLGAPEIGELSPPPLRSPGPEARRRAQRESLPLPPLPTTTIGSFPQTREIRALRADWRSGKLDQAAYDLKIKEAIASCVRFQEETGLDVLVHGEFERTDMVEYFGERLDGFAFTANGWVQSYGSRCVKPPIIHGPVSRPAPMTVETIAYAQGLASKPVKGMLTGPVTILNWSFPRIDVPRSTVCLELAKALEAEALDLEAAGIRIIQVDEAAFKEGYPLRAAGRASYERMAVTCFRTATGSVKPETRIHSHMCYSEFGDIMQAIIDMDLDALSIEAARDGERILDAFAKSRFDRELGPGVYDIHSPAVPETGEFVAAIRARLKVIAPDRLWINPDCGLKTRSWEEVEPSLRAMVEAARTVRAGL